MVSRDGSNSDDARHEVELDFAAKKLRIDAHWVDLSPNEAALFDALFREPLRPWSKADLTIEIFGAYQDGMTRDRRVEDCLHFFRRSHIANLYQSEMSIREHTFWEYQRKVGFSVKPTFKVVRTPQPTKDLEPLLNKSLTQLYWLIREGQRTHGDMKSIKGAVSVLEDLSRYCQQIWRTRRPDESELNWFNCIVRIASYLDQQGHPQGQALLRELGRWPEDRWRHLLGEMWAMEWRALYLEMVQDFVAAARASEQLALRVENRVQRESNLRPFSAALYARAAQCFNLGGEARQSAKLYTKAANLLTYGCRISVRALEYYQTALRLWPESPTRGHNQLEQKRLSLALTPPDHKHCVIALVANCFDADLADTLVHPMVQKRVVCKLILSDEIDDLSRLSAYDAVIIVGGIKARDTDYHVYRYFYDVPSVDKGLSFKLLDIDACHYCDRWYIELDDQPMYVLAGLSREDTYNSVINFAEGELGRLIRRLSTHS